MTKLRLGGRKPSVIYPQVSADEWARRYALNTSPITCPRCSKEFTPSIPFATMGWRGLLTEVHPCGPTYQLAVAKEFDEKGKNLWAEIYAAGKAAAREGGDGRPA